MKKSTVIITILLLFLIVFLARSTILFNGRDTVTSYNGWFVGYELFREFDGEIGRNNLALLTEKEHISWLESDIYMFRQVNHKLYIRGYSGDTVIDLYTNKIKQFRRNWGKTLGSSAENPEKIKTYFWIFYERVNHFDEFNPEEVELLTKPPKTHYEIKMSRNPYSEEEIIPKIVMIRIDGANQGQARIQVIDREKEAVIESNLIGIREVKERIFLYGKTGLTVIDSNGLKIKQLILTPENEDHDMINIKKIGLKEKYEIVEGFSEEDQKIFLELKENPEKYRPKF